MTYMDLIELLDDMKLSDAKKVIRVCMDMPAQLFNGETVVEVRIDINHDGDNAPYITIRRPQ